MRQKFVIPKLTPPRPANALARPRLFDWLDRAVPIVWISGPAGAGKTTLVATHAAERGLEPVWYHFDHTDSDPGVLFHCLAETLPNRRKKLPAFVDRYQAGSREFARRYFRQYFRAFSGQLSTLVFDGAEYAPSYALLEDAASEVPEGTRLVITSRDPPPAAFARLEVTGRLVHLSWEQLRFSPSETAAFVRRQAAGEGADDVDAAALHARSGGWAAGLCLLLEQARHPGAWHADQGTAPRDTLFRFIANEVFDRLPMSQQQLLLRTCLLPEIHALEVPVLLAGARPDEGLESLVNQKLLVDRLQGVPPVYRVHDLFREFLVQRARSTLAPVEFKALQRQAGELLAQQGRVEHAIDLLAAAGEWQRASQLILDNAAAMMARGHSVGLRHWVKALPGWYVDATPRLLYCLGMAQSTVEPALAMGTLERAHQRFAAQANALGQALCAAGIIQAYYFRYDNQHGMEQWGRALADLLVQDLPLPSPETELHLQSMLQVALTYREPGHPALAHCVRRILALLPRDIEINQRVVAGALLLPYCDWLEPDLAPLVKGLIQPLLKSRTVTAFNKLWWQGALAQHCVCGNAPRDLLTISREMDELAASEGIQPSAALKTNLALMRAIVGIDSSQQARSLLNQVRSPVPDRGQEQLNGVLYGVELLLQFGEVDTALQYAEYGVKVCRDLGVVIAETEALGLLALSHCLNGQLGRARAALSDAAERARAFSSPRILMEHYMLAAFLDRAEGLQESAMANLGHGLKLARQHELTAGHVLLPSYLARLCAMAIDADIEAAQARRMIETHELPPPPGYVSEAWPWRVTIRVLGREQILVDKVALRMTGKTQKKPLELLRALVVRGAEGGDLTRLADDLWPDSDGDAAHSNLRMTLHRLRSLLRYAQAIVVEEGRARLNERYVWVDAWLLVKDPSRHEGWATPAAQETKTGQQTILDLYRGEAFANAPAEPWILAARDHWRTRYQQLIESAADDAIARHAWGEACRLYETAIQAEPGCESFYQGLIRVRLDQHQLTDAEAAYQRCRLALQLTARKPSVDTEKLHERIRQRRAA